MDGSLDIVYPGRRERAKLLNEEIPPDRHNSVEVSSTRAREAVFLLEIYFSVKPSNLRRDLGHGYLSAEIEFCVP